MAQNKLNEHDHETLNSLDAELTTILVKADQSCVKHGTHPWSPALHTAYLIHYYWSQKLIQKCMGCNYPQVFACIKQAMSHKQLHPALSNSISVNLHATQNILHQIQKDALAKRQAHLDELISATNICKDKKRKQLILNLKCAEELCQCYALVCSMTKPQQAGGISHIKPPHLQKLLRLPAHQYMIPKKWKQEC